MTYTDAYAGQFYQDKPSLNANTVFNYFLTDPVEFHPTAIITRVVQFPDVSFYQGEIHYSIMRTETDTIILRIGQNLWEDDQFRRNYTEAKQNGMRVGGYWFYDDRISPREQAERLVAICEGKTFELEIYIDWETSYGGEFKGLRNVVAMMELVEMAIRVNIFKAKGVGLYTGYYFFRGNSNSVANASQYAYLKSKPLWLAWYTTNPADVLIPAPWSDLTLWQFGTPAVNWGQETKEIDMNFFNGTRLEFELRYGEAGEIPMTDHVELTPNSNTNRTIRRPVAYPQVPHIIGTGFGSLLAGTTIETGVSDHYVYTSNVTYNGIVQAFAGDKWWKVLYNGEVGWIAEIHKGDRYLNVTVVSDTPPTLPTLLIDVADDAGLYIPVRVELKPK